MLKILLFLTFQLTDTDLVFEDLLDEDVHTPFKNAHSLNKRSISSDEGDIDVEELFNIDESGEHWLWGSMKRIRRSIDKLLGTENPSEVSESTERQPNHMKKQVPKHRKKFLVNGEKGKYKKIFKNDGKFKSIGSKKMFMRSKRQDYEDDNEFDDDEDEDDEDILEPVSSGGSPLPETELPEVSEKEDRLCKLFCFTYAIVINMHNAHKYHFNSVHNKHIQILHSTKST